MLAGRRIGSSLILCLIIDLRWTADIAIEILWWADAIVILNLSLGGEGLEVAPALVNAGEDRGAAQLGSAEAGDTNERSQHANSVCGGRLAVCHTRPHLDPHADTYQRTAWVHDGPSRGTSTYSTSLYFPVFGLVAISMSSWSCGRILTRPFLFSSS